MARKCSNCGMKLIKNQTLIFGNPWMRPPTKGGSSTAHNHRKQALRPRNGCPWLRGRKFKGFGGCREVCVHLRLSKKTRNVPIFMFIRWSIVCIGEQRCSKKPCSIGGLCHQRVLPTLRKWRKKVWKTLLCRDRCHRKTHGTVASIWVHAWGYEHG